MDLRANRWTPWYLHLATVALLTVVVVLMYVANPDDPRCIEYECWFTGWGMVWILAWITGPYVALFTVVLAVTSCLPRRWPTVGIGIGVAAVELVVAAVAGTVVLLAARP